MGIPPTVNSPPSGTNAHSIDEIALWVKSIYHTARETPHYFTNQPTVIPAGHFHPLFVRAGFNVDVRKTNYRYCNLPSAQWAILRSKTPPKFPLLWEPTSDPSGQRLIVTVDFATDLLWEARIPEQAFSNELARIERLIRATGETNFSLGEWSGP
jgi:hypothetical protein